jgi:general secretion pathway protein G
LAKVADIFDEEVKWVLDRLVALTVPTLTSVLGLVLAGWSARSSARCSASIISPRERIGGRMMTSMHDDRAMDGRANRWWERGFTLIELLVVLAILGMLAAIAVPQVLKYLGRAKEDVVKVQVQSLGTSLDLFLLDVGRYPTDQEGLQALVSPPPGLGQWHGPYVTKANSLVDPWGHPYVYHQPGQQGSDYDLYSLGPTGNGQPPSTGSPSANAQP